MRRFNSLAAAGLLLGLIGVGAPASAEQPEVVPGYTLPADERLALLRRAQQADALREQAKAKGQTLTIVEDGKPLATIVGDGKEAKVLQDWIKRMSGAELPIADAAPAEGPVIYVGDAAVAAGLKLDDIESESSEGLRIKCDGRNIYIAAQSEPAHMRAVGRFLEEEFGCRYLSTQPWGMVYPEQRTLKVLVREFSEKPTFRYRRIWGANGAFSNAIWRAWSGHGGNDTPMSHSWGGLLPKGSFEQHPDWYRMDESGNRVDGHWPNLGHPDVRKRFIEYALELSENGTKSISLSPPDNHQFDYSPEARQYDAPEEIDPSSGLVSMTNRYLGLVNDAARKLYAINPKAEVGFYAYSDYTLPPTNSALDKLSPNLAIWIAPIRFSRYHPIGHPYSKSNTLLKSIVEGWAKRASMIGWRTYNYNLAEVMTPYSRITVWAHDLPWLKAHGAYGLNLESFDSWEIYAPHLYLSIRLGYDPTLNPWEIMADYWHKAYGPAAEPMMNYWMTIDEAFAHIQSESGSYHALHLVYTPERIAKLDSLLSQAEKLAAGDEGNAKRVHLARRGLNRGQHWRAWYDAINKGDVANALETYDKWYAVVQEAQKARDANSYEPGYLRRFIGKKMDRLRAFLNPQDGKPAEVAAVLPDQWQYANGDMLEKIGFSGDPFAVDASDSAWDTVRTWSGTLNEQGYDEYFGPMWYRTTFKAPKDLGARQSFYVLKADRKVTVYINGKQLGEGNHEGFSGVGIDISGALKPGQDNQVTLRIDHIPLPELFLGGLVEPVYLVKHVE